jgi:hypothetical protein
MNLFLRFHAKSLIGFATKEMPAVESLGNEWPSSDSTVWIMLLATHDRHVLGSRASDGENVHRPAAGQRNCWMITDQLNPKAQYRPPMDLSACLDHCAVLHFLPLFLFTFSLFFLCFCHFAFLCFSLLLPLCFPLVSVNSFVFPFYHFVFLAFCQSAILCFPLVSLVSVLLS